MNKRVKIVLLGLMIWVITFMSGFFIFVIFGAEASDLGVWTWISGIKEFSITIGLALGLFLVYKDKGQDYKRTAWEAGISWYVILLLMDLIVLIGLMGLEIELGYPSIFTYSTVAIIPIVVGYLLAGPKEKV
jgi:hypothetical protein